MRAKINRLHWLPINIEVTTNTKSIISGFWYTGRRPFFVKLMPLVIIKTK